MGSLKLDQCFEMESTFLKRKDKKGVVNYVLSVRKLVLSTTLSTLVMLI